MDNGPARLTGARHVIHMFDVQVMEVPAALAASLFNNVYDVQVERMLVEFTVRFSDIGRRVRRFII